MHSSIIFFAACAHAASSSSISLDDSGPSRVFHGLGGLSGGGATSVFLRAYPEPQRTEVLDFLFKPNFGASLQILKVEIGGEGQSTDGAESSHWRRGDEAPDMERGYEFWLMKEARARNPNITLYGLPWTWPAWIACANGTLSNCSSSPFSNLPSTVEYITSWVRGAKEVHGLDINWLGAWNERSAGDDYIQSLRAGLDAGGFTETRLITWDNWLWAAPNGSDAMGKHYPGISPAPSAALATGLPMWSSEESSTYNNQFGAECVARVFNQNYAVGSLTASIVWNLVAAYGKGTNWYRTGLLTALQPWSGAYGTQTVAGWSAGPMVWATAHTTQFTRALSWSYLAIANVTAPDSPSGAGLLPNGGSYVTLKDFATGDFTIVIEKMSHNFSSCVRPNLDPFTTLPEVVTFTLKGGLTTATTLRVFRSHWAFADSDEPTEEFIEQASIPVVGGVFSVNVTVDSMYTLTTLPAGVGVKGAPAAPPPSASPSSIFPAWHFESFDSCNSSSEANFFSDQSGAFECTSAGGARSGMSLRSVTPVIPIGWGGDVRPHTLLGHRDTVNVSLTADFLLEDANATALIGVRCSKLISTSGLILSFNTTAWALWGEIGLKGRPQASGAFSAPHAPGSWHTARVDVNGSSLRVWLDGTTLTPTPISVGGAGYGGHALFGAGDFGEFVQFDNVGLASTFTACPASGSAQPSAGSLLQVTQCSSEVGLQPGSAFDYSAARGGVGAISLKGSSLCIETSAPADSAPSAPWPVSLVACDATAAGQAWQWVFDAVCPQNKRDSRIVNPASGRCLDMQAGWDAGLGDFPNEGASAVVGSPITATPCADKQSNSQNIFYDFAAREFANQGSVSCLGVCTG